MFVVVPHDICKKAKQSTVMSPFLRMVISPVLDVFVCFDSLTSSHPWYQRISNSSRDQSCKEGVEACIHVRSQSKCDEDLNYEEQSDGS